MTKATNALVEKLSHIIDENKYLLLSGTMAVGKTYLATLIADECQKKQYSAQGKLTKEDHYEVVSELIPVHPSLYYEDFVAGITISTTDGKVNFQYADKIFINLLKRANNSWRKKEDKKYFLILDDIGRGDISGIMGDTLALIEPHGNISYVKRYGNYEKLFVSPNIYIIATLSTIVESVNQMNYGFLRHFYEYTIDSDYSYIDDASTSVISDFDISANALFYRTKRIVRENLRDRFQLTERERGRFIMGHGMFKREGATLAVKYQIIPMLWQYVKDNVLCNTAKASISALEKLVDGQYSKDKAYADMGRIVLNKRGVTADSFKNEGLTHQPLVNLVSRIKEQGLVDDTDIVNEIMFNPEVVVRKKAKLDKIERTFPSPAYLYVERSLRDKYTYGTTITKTGESKRPRFFYSGNKEDSISVDGVDFAIASEMQPGEYTRWYEDLDVGNEENERYSSSPNSIMFRILRSYYRSLNSHYEGYLKENPGDDNVARLKAFSEQEYRHLVSETRLLHPEISDEKDVNAKANDDFREVIHNLELLWKNIGDSITIGDQSIIVEGAYKVDNTKKYEEYYKAMEVLGTHQMILQGPPGSSKTYSSREFLKFVANSNAGVQISDEELDSLQISNYENQTSYSEWMKKTPGKLPKIAWDIVQFHPSYGYEDFVRGIEVGTIKTGTSSAVSYDTVNKILGKISNLASQKGNEKTKFFLVIDEINRANLATVFGELIYGLEYRGRKVATPYTVNNDNKVSLPDNLYIIGTMNTADKSIGGIDYAIRRRFLFFPLLPDRSVILEYRNGKGGNPDAEKKQIKVNEKAAMLFDRVAELFTPDNLNAEYFKDDVQIGHTYFMVDSEEQLFLRFRYQILPILREYYKDGLFQFEIYEEEDGWNGLLKCISGVLDVNQNESRIKDIFDKLTTIND